jgi:hypothetical protein
MAARPPARGRRRHDYSGHRSGAAGAPSVTPPPLAPTSGGRSRRRAMASISPQALSSHVAGEPPPGIHDRDCLRGACRGERRGPSVVPGRRRRGLFVRLRSVSGFRHTRRRRQSSGPSPRQAQAPGPDADHSTGVGRGWGEPARPSPNRDAVLVAALRLGPARSGPQGSAVPADRPEHRFGSPWSGLGPGRAGSGWFAPRLPRGRGRHEPQPRHTTVDHGWMRRTTTHAAQGSEPTARTCPFGICWQRSRARARRACSWCAGSSTWKRRGCDRRGTWRCAFSRSSPSPSTRTPERRCTDSATAVVARCAF